MNCVADGDVVSSAPARLTVLDGLRGCAVLMVMAVVALVYPIQRQLRERTIKKTP